MNETDRLLKILESENLNAKQFAQEIGVSPGTVSNILGGRNNPSLDVIQRVLNRFRTISSDWLLFGTGSMYRLNGGMQQGTLFDIKPDNSNNAITQTEEQVTATESGHRNTAVPQTNSASSRTIEKILIFYSDGTFEER